MKKSILLMAGLVGLALTSCEEDNSLGTMQKNEAPIVVPADGVALQSVYNANGNHISLQSFEATQMVPLVNIEISNMFPENMQVSGQVEIADNADFNKAVTIDLASAAAPNRNTVLAEAAGGGETRSYQGYVTVLEWNNAFVSFYGLNPATNVNYLRYKLWLSDGDQSVILYNKNGEEWFDAMQFDVTPLDAQLDVNPTYYLNYLVNLTGDIHSVEMYHNPANHVYDDPNFNAMVEVEEGDVVYWWITPNENSGGTPYGVAVDDPTASSGSLGVIDTQTYGNGQIDVPGVYKIDVNMLELTYEVKVAPNSLYVMYQGGNFDDVAQLGSSDYVNFSGMAGLLNKWVLTGQNNYKPTLYVGVPDSEETIGSNGVATGSIMFSADGVTAATNNGISYGGHAGLFYLTANLSTLEYTRYYCSTIGVVGEMNNWGNENPDGSKTPDVALKGSRTTLYMEWKGQVTIEEGQQWKIRANNEWVVDFGCKDASGAYATDGTPVEIVKENSNNFIATETGTYNMTVYFKRQYKDGAMTPYTMTLEPVAE